MLSCVASHLSILLAHRPHQVHHPPIGYITYNYIWVLHNPDPYALVDVIAVADSNSGYVSTVVDNMTVNEILTRTFTILLHPYSALAVQGSSRAVR